VIEDYKGRHYNTVQLELEQAGLKVVLIPKKVSTEQEDWEDAFEGMVIAQNKDTQTRLKEGGVIELTYATLITIYPDFTDGTWDKKKAQTFCDDNKITCKFEDKEDSTHKEGIIIGQGRQEGGEVKEGVTLTLEVAKKPLEKPLEPPTNDNSNTNDSMNMYSPSANKIITGSGVIDLLVQDDSSLTTNITPTFIFKSKDVVDLFIEEVKQKGLNEYYTINTNLEELENATKSIENVKTFATTFLIITLIISSIVLFVINMINIRERKYEIGVFRTIGVSKFKLTMQFVLELLIVSIIMLMIGATCGSYLSKPIGNMLLQNEIEDTQNQEQEISNNFGKGPMDMRFNGNKQVEEISTIDAVVDVNVVVELLGIGILLTLISSLASMISIQRFSPLTILKERS